MNELNTTGVIDENGRLNLYMPDVRAFGMKNKGARVTVTITAASKGSSKAIQAYYFNYIVPMFQKGMARYGEKMPKSKVERMLREGCEFLYTETVDVETGEYTQTIRKVPELSNAEMVEYIEYLKQKAAEDFQIYIEDPSVL